MAGGYRVDLGWARSAPSIFDRAAGAVVDRRRGPSPLVHGGPSGGGGFLLLIWVVGCDLRLWSHACPTAAPGRPAAAPGRNLAGGSPAMANRS
jgi:hypothetical protein